jgi:hypothetical protein
MLNAFRASLPSCVTALLRTIPSRLADESSIESISDRGRTLWSNIHRPFEKKLEQKLGNAHPDLPIFIINNEYGGLFANPEGLAGTFIGRIATSVLVIACLRAQDDLDLPLRSHVLGLKKAWEDGSWKAEPEIGPEEAIRWLVSDEGCIWVLTKADELVDVLRGTFTRVEAKL